MRRPFFFSRLRERPLVRFLPFLLLGILSGRYLPQSPPLLLLIACIGLTALLLSTLIRRRYSRLRGFLTALTLTATSCLLSMQQGQSGLQSEPIETGLRFRGLGILEERHKSAQFDLRLLLMQTGDRFRHCSGLYRVYLPTETRAGIGDSLIFEGRVFDFQSAALPGMFDFRAFMHERGILGGISLRRSPFRILPAADCPLDCQLDRLEMHCLERLNEGLEKREAGLMAAVLLGNRSQLESELKSEFSSSGTIHVMAVSGLHVGIIFLLIQTLLKPFGKRFPWLNCCILLLGLWSYALFTGASASVCRASLMCSLFAFSRLQQLTADGWNVLAAACMLLLIHQPAMLTEAGFQLSFLAVGGILGFQEPVYRLWNAPLPVLDRLWQWSSVSIAAQLATFPLILLLFHQFPFQFLPANLIVVPAISLLVYIGMLFLLLDPILPDIVWKFGLQKPLEWLLELVGILGRAGLPGQDRLYGKPMAVVLLYILLGSLLIAFHNKDKRLLTIFAILLFALISSLHADWWNTRCRRELILPAEKEAFCLIRSGRQGRFFGKADSDPFALKRRTDYRHALRIHQLTQLNIEIKQEGENARNWMVFNESLLPTTLDTLQHCPEFVVIGGGNSSRYCREMRSVLQKEGIPHHILKFDGSFIHTIPQQ